MQRRAVIYVRVSSTNQAEKGYSLPTQIEACQKYAERNELEVVAVESDDESGARLERDGLSRVREMFRAGAANTLIVHQPDRLNRDYVHSILLGRELKSAGVEVHYARRGAKAGDTPEEQFIDNLEALVAELDRERIKERTMRGRLGKAKSGKYIGNGLPPYGYKRVGEKGNVTLVAVDAEARIVGLIFEWYVIGDGEGPLGVREIVDRLTQMGTPSPGDRRAKSNKRRAFGEWNATAIYDILSQPTYTGTAYAYRFKMVESTSKRGVKAVERPKEEWVPVTVPAIIAQEIFDAAQKRLAQGREQSPRNSRHQYLMGRKIECECTYKVQGKPSHSKGKVYLYYHCNGNDRSVTARRCDLPGIPAAKFDAQIWEWVVETLLDTQKLEAELRRQQEEAEEEQAKLDSEKAHLLEQIVEIEAELSRLLSLYSKSKDGQVRVSEKLVLPEDLILKEIAQREQNRAKLFAEVEKLEEQAKTVVTDEGIQTVMDLAAELRLKADHADFDKKRRLIEALNVTAKISQKDGEVWAKAKSIIATKDLLVLSNPSYSRPCQSRSS